MNKTVIFIVLALGIGLSSGYLLGARSQKLEVSKTVTVLPSPSPEVKSEFNNDKAEVKSADGKKFVYVINGTEKTLTDLTGITVWKLPAEGTEAAEINWDGVKAGDKVQIASEKATGKVVAVLVLGLE